MQVLFLSRNKKYIYTIQAYTIIFDGLLTKDSLHERKMCDVTNNGQNRFQNIKQGYNKLYCRRVGEIYITTCNLDKRRINICGMIIVIIIITILIVYKIFLGMYIILLY